MSSVSAHPPRINNLAIETPTHPTRRSHTETHTPPGLTSRTAYHSNHSINPHHSLYSYYSNHSYRSHRQGPDRFRNVFEPQDLSRKVCSRAAARPRHFCVSVC